MPSQDSALARPEPLEVSATARVLGIRFSALGDTLLTFPALRLLKATYPHAHLAFLTDVRCAGLFDGLEVLDELLTLDRLALKSLQPRAAAQLWSNVLCPSLLGRWDIVVDFQGFTETAAIGALTRAPIRIGRRYKTGARRLYRPWIDTPHPPSYMTGAHIDTITRAGLVPAPPASPDGLPSFFSIPPEATRRWQDRSPLPHTPTAEPVPHIAFFVGAAKADKLWPPERFAQLARRLSNDVPHSFLIFAGPGEQAITRQVIDHATRQGLAGRVVDGGCGDLATLAAAFGSCSATVSNDTGPLHLSAAVGTPTLGIFRDRNPHFIPPPPHRHIVATGGQIETITVDEVADAAHQLLA
ncbi:MAG TPA: glycosyltransferase family 9 protein [Acidobacteriota bacterium]|nr:glycosyltransferase family 9 protein [Acidobacteriota bacterium]